MVHRTKFDSAKMGFGVLADSSLSEIDSGMESGGALTLVGSPNFGFRSVERDFESQLLVVTDNMELARKMQAELEESIVQHTTLVTDQTWEHPDRKLSWSPLGWKDGWWISPGESSGSLLYVVRGNANKFFHPFAFHFNPHLLTAQCRGRTQERILLQLLEHVRGKFLLDHSYHTLDQQIIIRFALL